MYRQIAFTGLDRLGKATQAKLLQTALQPSRFISFPDYSHWTGQVIRGVLSEEEFEIHRWKGGTEEVITAHKQPKEPYLFQALQFANVRSHAAAIREGLKTAHWVMDRCPECALAYGLVDGCDLEFLLALQRPLPPSDRVFVLVGRPMARPGETPDLNERDLEFQGRVRRAYEGLCGLFPERFTLIDVNYYREPNTVASIGRLHRRLCELVEQQFGGETALTPLSDAAVAEQLGLAPTGQLALDL
jgi:thymidylate kinase